MPEDNDFTPAPWAAHDNFASARAAYDVHVGRSYDDAKALGKGAKDLLEPSVSTDSAAPIVIMCDVTGSMGAWPATIFSKLPYLDNEAREYFGDDYAISFGAIGDAQAGSKYALQVRKFGQGRDLEQTLKELVVEGGGGSNMIESYDLAMLYFDRNCEMPNAQKPIFIMIGDESFYPLISKEDAKKWCDVDTNTRLSTFDIVKSLQQKFAVYLIRKPYNPSSDADHESESDKKIRLDWEGLLGADHIAMLPEAGRVVDVIFGIFAKETGRYDDFKKELEDRQGKDKDGKHKIDVVMKSLNTIHRDASSTPKLPKQHSLKKLPAPGTMSVTRRGSDTVGRSSKSLLDD